MRIMEREKARQLKAKKKARQIMERARLRDERMQQKKMAQKLMASRKAERLVERIAYSNRSRVQDSSDEDVDFVSDDDGLFLFSESDVHAVATTSSSTTSTAPQTNKKGGDRSSYS